MRQLAVSALAQAAFAAEHRDESGFSLNLPASLHDR